MSVAERRVTDVPVPPQHTPQDLILRATFLPGDAGLEAWRGWKSAVDLDDSIDFGSYRVLPELGRRLRHRGVEDPLLARFAGISRKHWLANRLAFTELESLVRSLDAHGVRVMLSAEVALALLHYPDHPLDPLRFRTFGVSPEQAATAFRALEGMGWIPTPPVGASLLDRYVGARSWHGFRTSGGAQLWLHWHVFAQQARPATDQAFWSRASEAKLGDAPVAALSPTDQVLQLCTRRVGWRMTPLFERAVDVVLLISACPDRIDWDDLVERSALPGLDLPVRDTLRYLRGRLDPAVPAWVVERIQRNHVSALEHVEYELAGKPDSRVGDLLGFWLDYRRTSPTNALLGAVRFPRFLQDYLKLPRLWQVPFRALAGATSHLFGRTGDEVNRRTASGAPTPVR